MNATDCTGALIGTMHHLPQFLTTHEMLQLGLACKDLRKSVQEIHMMAVHALLRDSMSPHDFSKVPNLLKNDPFFVACAVNRYWEDFYGVEHHFQENIAVRVSALFSALLESPAAFKRLKDSTCLGSPIPNEVCQLENLTAEKITNIKQSWRGRELGALLAQGAPWNENKELVLIAVQQNGHALKYASPALQADKELVMVARLKGTFFFKQ
jgi:hypothetical protein